MSVVHMIEDIVLANHEVRVTLRGNIYVEQASSIREQLLDYMEEGHKNFMINVAAVDYIDSSGLGVLVALHKRTQQVGGQLTIQGLHGVVKELFELTRLTKVFTIV